MDIAINYYAVFVAAVFSLALGVVWYGPLFGREWMRLSELTPEKMKAMPLAPWQAMGGGFVNALVIAYVLSMFTALWAFDIMSALLVAVWIWVGFVVTTQIAGFLWEGKPFRLFLIHASYSFVSYMAMVIIFVLWR